jgi:hypothetical protein
MQRAEEPITGKMKIDIPARQNSSANLTASHIRKPAHQPGDPQSKVGQRHPGILNPGVLEDCLQKPEDRLLRVLIGKHFFEDLTIKSKDRSPRVIDRG